MKKFEKGSLLEFSHQNPSNSASKPVFTMRVTGLWFAVRKGDTVWRRYLRPIPQPSDYFSPQILCRRWVEILAGSMDHFYHLRFWLNHRISHHFCMIRQRLLFEVGFPSLPLFRLPFELVDFLSWRRGQDYSFNCC